MNIYTHTHTCIYIYIYIHIYIVATRPQEYLSHSGNHYTPRSDQCPISPAGPVSSLEREVAPVGMAVPAVCSVSAGVFRA